MHVARTSPPRRLSSVSIAGAVALLASTPLAGCASTGEAGAAGADAGADASDAGLAALLVAKVHKIDDRKDSDRQSDKDALDVLRLLRGTETDDLAARYVRLLGDKRSEDAARRARELLEAPFARRQHIGVQMATRSAGVLGDAEEIAVLFEALVGDLLTALR
jgi:hypothetical protein